VQELVIDYSKCATDAPEGDNSGDFVKMPAELVTSYFKSSNCTPTNEPVRWKRNSTTVKYGKNLDEAKKTPTTICSLQFIIPDNIGPPVLFYYRLTNFYQNHRRYVKSLDTNQLQGAAVPNSTIGGGSCDPLRLDNKKRPYYPCGLIANSVFNDTFTSPVKILSSSNNETYHMTDKGIAWASDKALYGPTKYNYADIAVPPNWVERWPSGEYTENNPPPQLQNDEHFQVWMRTAGLPAFSKLALRNDNQTMSCGMYQVDIQMSMQPSFVLCYLLTTYRLSRYRVWRIKIHCHIYSDSNGREEPVPRHRLRRCWWDMYCPWCPVHCGTSHKATVRSYPELLKKSTNRWSLENLGTTPI